MTNVMVFGGAGYIGSHTCKCLKANGFSPVVFDNFSEGHREFVRWGDWIEADICDGSAVEDAVRRVAPAFIIHFAALAYVGASVTNPADYYQTNVAGTLNIATAARSCGNIPIIFSSSCATYGTPEAARISEETAQRPINPYGRTKLMGEHLLQDFHQAYGLNSVCLRYFNACGADPDGQIGEAHREETHLIPRAILAALGQVQDFRVFGDDYETPDGSAVRDYVHVEDLATAHVAACQYLQRGGETDQFNIGTGSGFSVLEVIDAVARGVGCEVPYSIAPRRAGDPPFLVADPSKARSQLGFEPRYSSLENIVATAISWHSSGRSPLDGQLGRSGAMPNEPSAPGTQTAREHVQPAG